MGKRILSQSIEALADSLAEILTSDGTSFLQKKWILVPNGQLKQWLSLRLGRQNCLTGCKICSVEEALFSRGTPCPTLLEMTCLIYDQLRNGPPAELVPFLETSPKRRKELAEQLALLFSSYGLHGKALFANEKGGWQRALFEALFRPGSFQLPFQILPKESPILRDPVHCFGFDFLPENYWESLNRLPLLHIYLFSPCIYFWEDLCTDLERRNLSLFWQQKGASLGARRELEQYLNEAPPLLANWGKVGRETLKALDPLSLQSIEAYVPMPEDNRLLHSLQREIVFFEKNDASLAADGSLEVFLTGSSKMNEIEVLKEEILHLAATERIPFSEINVLAPDIQPYIPLIEFLFSDPAAPIPYRISSVDIGSQSSFYQGIQRLALLAKEEWRAERLIGLIETPSVYKRQGWTRKKVDTFSAWAKEIVQLSDWKKGLEKMIYRLVTLFPTQGGIFLGSADLIEEFLVFLQSLEKDLAPFRSEAARLGIWAERWEALVAQYLVHDLEEESDAAVWRDFQNRLLDLRKADARLGDIAYPFEVIDAFMCRPSSGSIHGNQLHSVRIGSIQPGSILPARAFFLIGMDEESFPRKKIRSSLDLLKNAALYVPEKPEIDRYLFLQILFAAKDFLKISYGHLSADEGKPVGPSLLVTELLHALPVGDIPRVRAKTKSPKQELPVRFTIQSPAPKKLSEGEQIVSLADLSSFARHPWKHYLKKIEGIYFDDRRDPSFALERAPLLRASLKWPLETVLSSDPDLPPGIFKEAFLVDLEARALAWRKKWKERGDSLLSLSFLESAQTEAQTKERREFPPLELEVDGGRVSIVGEIQYATERGALHLGEDQMASLLKSWPEILTASVALGTSEIYFLKSGKIKTISDPLKSLKAFISYYFRCTGSLSPLLPDWADGLLRKGPEDFEPKSEYPDPVMEWVISRLEMPIPESLFTEWGWLKESFAGLIGLYPTRSKKETSETV